MLFIVLAVLLSLPMNAEVDISVGYEFSSQPLNSGILIDCISNQNSANLEGTTESSIIDVQKENEFEWWRDRVIMGFMGALTIFFISQAIHWRDRKIKTKDAKVALISELKISKKFLEQVFTHIKDEEKNLNSEKADDFYKRVKVFKSTLPKALSTQIYKNLDNTQLRKTAIIESVISLYTNINVFSAYCESGLTDNKALDKREVKLFTFWILILILQIEVNLALLNSKWYKTLSFKKARPITVVNIEFFHTIWGLAKNNVDQRRVNSSVFSSLQAFRNEVILLFRLEDHFSFEGQDDPEYTHVVDHQEVAIMLEAIDSSNLRREYNDNYAWLLKAFKD